MMAPRGSGQSHRAGTEELLPKGSACTQPSSRAADAFAHITTSPASPAHSCMRLCAATLNPTQSSSGFQWDVSKGPPQSQASPQGRRLHRQTLRPDKQSIREMRTHGGGELGCDTKSHGALKVTPVDQPSAQNASLHCSATQNPAPSLTLDETTAFPLVTMWPVCITS